MPMVSKSRPRGVEVEIIDVIVITIAQQTPSCMVRQGISVLVSSSYRTRYRDCHQAEEADENFELHNGILNMGKVWRLLSLMPAPKDPPKVNWPTQEKDSLIYIELLRCRRRSQVTTTHPKYRNLDDNVSTKAHVPFSGCWSQNGQ